MNVIFFCVNQIFRTKKLQAVPVLLTSTLILAQMPLTTSEALMLACARWCLQSLSSAIAAQESLSGLETEMRKLEGIVKEIVEEMDYLKRREQRFSSTNGRSQHDLVLATFLIIAIFVQSQRTNASRVSGSTLSLL